MALALVKTSATMTFGTGRGGTDCAKIWMQILGARPQSSAAAHSALALPGCEMNLERTRRWLHRLAGLATALTLLSIVHGVWRGLRRPAGRISGRRVAWLRQPGFYLAAGTAYFAVCALLWRPLPARRPPSRLKDWIGLALGTLLYFPGLALVVCGRLALGRDYFVSTTVGAQLFAGHRLVTHGPYAWVRHPMYLGLTLAGLGGLLIYRTWTWVLVTLNAPALLLRARREEAALSAEFGTAWQAYAQRVRYRLLPGVW